jgi:RND family efflux transporter MFP subunit
MPISPSKALALVLATALATSVPFVVVERPRAAAAVRAFLSRGVATVGHSLARASNAVLARHPAAVPALAEATSAVPTRTSAPSVNAAAPRAAYLGVVLARTSADIAPRFDGRLATVNVRVGDSVAQGAVLATLSVPTLRYDLRVAEAELQAATLDVDRASTELNQATERFARKQRLDAEHLALADDVTGADYQSRLAKTRLSSARSVASERRAQVERLRQDEGDTQIVAPFDGVVAARYVDPGMSVHSLVPVVRLITMNDILARFAVPQADAARIGIGDGVRIRTTETHRDLRGAVERVAAEVEPASRLIFVEARVTSGAAPSSAVPSGELARVEIASEAP